MNNYLCSEKRVIITTYLSLYITQRSAHSVRPLFLFELENDQTNEVGRVPTVAVQLNWSPLVVAERSFSGQKKETFRTLSCRAYMRAGGKYALTHSAVLDEPSAIKKTESTHKRKSDVGVQLHPNGVTLIGHHTRCMRRYNGGRTHGSQLHVIRHRESFVVSHGIPMCSSLLQSNVGGSKSSLARFIHSKAIMRTRLSLWHFLCVS